MKSGAGLAGPSRRTWRSQAFGSQTETARNPTDSDRKDSPFIRRADWCRNSANGTIPVDLAIGSAGSETAHEKTVNALT